MNGIEQFLATSPIFSGMPPEQIRELAPLFRSETYQAGTIILKQGGYSNAVYFLRSGRLNVKIKRGLKRETVAVLNPPDVFGELSYLTGRQCVADVEVAVDSEIVYLPREAVPTSGSQREALMRGLLGALATRLQVTMQRGATAAELPVVLIRNGPHWQAPRAFAAELADSLARQTELNTVLIHIGAGPPGALRQTGPKTWNVGVRSGGPDIRAEMTRLLTELKSFPNVVVNITGNEAAKTADDIHDLTNFTGFLLGPGDAIPEISTDKHFIVQTYDHPTLPYLSGSWQLIQEEGESEKRYADGRGVTARFRHTVDSIARRIAGIQVGLALGGGAAWGWAHIGVLEALREAGLPVDLLAGCSMGSVIGSLYAAGRSIEELTEISNYWRNRTSRFIEWRFWRMCLISERMVRKVFTGYFDSRGVNQTQIPFWANAVDIEQGAEATIRDGSLVDCVRSSIALPGLLPPHARPPKLLVDAGIMDPVPAVLLREMGAHYAIGINAMAAPGTTTMNARYPFNAFEVMNKCMFVMGHEIGQRAEGAADMVYTPDLAGINMLQFNRAPEIIERGKRATEERVPQILAGYQHLKESLRHRETADAAPL